MEHLSAVGFLVPRFSDTKKNRESARQNSNSLDVNIKSFYAKYDMKEVIGRGVSCSVRRCIDKKTLKEYAAKVIDITKGDDQLETIRKETINEIAILDLCSGLHNIIKLHDTYESPAFFFLIFELLGKELFDHMTDIVTMSEKRARFVMWQLFDAIDFIHSKMIVHRDVKPENILLDENLNIKLADFGIAAIIKHDEELKDLVGTPGYMAPEVVKRSMFADTTGYGRPVDCWACGVVMYTLICGSPPFWHRKQLLMLRKIMEGKYDLTTPEWSDIRDVCKDLISKLLVVDVTKRLTASSALAHPFFHVDITAVREVKEEKKIAGIRKFRVAVIAARFVVYLRQGLQMPSFSIEQLKKDPYAIHVMRRIIDGGAFRIYGHWVRKGEIQNRALLFENRLKKTGSDIKTLTL